MDLEQRGESGALTFFRRSASLNALFAVEAGVGFLLDLVIAATFGLSGNSDALYAAWKLPQAVGLGMFQSLSASFMGLFADPVDRARRYSEAMTVVASLALPLAAVFSATSAWWLPPTMPGSSPETRLIAVPLATVLAWLVGSSALAESFRAICYREGQLWLPSLARLVGQLVAIAFALAAGTKGEPLLAAWGITTGVALEALIDLLGLRWLCNVTFRPSWPSRARLSEMAAAVGAPVAGQGVQVLAGVGQRALASLLPAGSITAVSYASRIMGSLERFVFQGFVVMTVQMYPSSDNADLRARFRWVTLVAIPLSVAFAVLARPLVAIGFGRGRFGIDDVGTLALALQMYATAPLGEALTRIPLGLAYARKRGGVIFGFLSIVSAVTLLSEAVLIRFGLGLRAFGLGYSLAMGLGFVWLYFLVLRRPRARVLARADSARLLAVGLSTWTGTAMLASLVRRWTASSQWADWLGVAAGTLGCALLFFASARLAGLHEVSQFLKAGRRTRR